MYAVIFRAEILELDAEYAAMAKRMRDLAIDEYGCVEFIACTEGNNEVAISYWENEAQIQQWKKNSEHLVAQDKGRSKWYKSYTVQVVKMVRAYRSTT
jgi:heme-degrading monooxygenase HmoA